MIILFGCGVYLLSSPTRAVEQLMRSQSDSQQTLWTYESYFWSKITAVVVGIAFVSIGGVFILALIVAGLSWVTRSLG